MYCDVKTFSGKVLVTRFLMFVMNMFRHPVLAVDLETAGPDVLKSHVIQPLFNQTYPGCWLGSQFYMIGDRWSPSIEPNGVMVCVKCQCAQVIKGRRVQLEGKVLCTNIKHDCPKPKCNDPILRPYTCCKICPGQDTSFEDQFTTIEYPLPSKTDKEGSKLLHKDMTALLVGGGHLKQGKRPVRTRAVAMVHITNTTEDAFNFAIRYSRLKDPVFFKITDEYGNPVIVRRIPKQMSRSGTIYDKVIGIPKNYIRYVLHSHAYVTITTLRHKKGEIHGRLRINTIANAASFESLLNPPDKSGTGALFTMFYDVTTKMASFVIQIDGIRQSRIVSDEYFVTFEKDTEIIHQHLLRFSYQKHQLIGKISVDSRMSKQIARGRVHVRVTSRAGETMVGLVRPRLLKTGMMAAVAEANQTIGYVLMSLLDDGILKFKVSVEVTSSASITVTLQRPVRNLTRWRDFTELLQDTEYVVPRDDTDDDVKSHLEVEGVFKKMRARDIVLIQNAAFRIKVTINKRETYSRIYTIPNKLSFLFKASNILLHSIYCETASFVFYEVSRNCSGLKYHIVAAGAREETNDMTLTLHSKNAGIVTRKLMAPEGAINGVGIDVFRDLNHKTVTARLRVSDDICDLFEGKVKIKNKCWRENAGGAGSQENGLELDTSDIFRCYYEGQFYTHAQSWLPIDGNPCVTCRCNRGSVYCDQMVCPPTSCSYPIKRDGECCHVCDDDNDTERKHSGACYFDGDKRWHPVGSYWHPYVPPFGYSKCALCNCVETTLEVNCTRTPCPELTCPAQQRVRVKPDDCCQVCRGENDATGRLQGIFLKEKPKGKEECRFGERLFQHGDKWHPVLHPFGEMKCYTCTCKNGKSRCKKQRCQPLDCRQQYRPSGKCCPVCAEKMKTPRTKASNEITG